MLGAALLLGLASADTATVAYDGFGPPPPAREARAPAPRRVVLKPGDARGTPAERPRRGATARPPEAPGTDGPSAVEPHRPTPAAPEGVRHQGEAGESCRAALDCRPELRCVDRVCVAPRADRPPRTHLRLGIELGSGAAWIRTEQTPLAGGVLPTDEGRAALVAAALGVLELGLDDGAWTFGVGGGVATPRGTLDDDAGIAARVDLRAGWRIWTDGRAAGFYLEPRLELLVGDVPGPVGFGGALAGRLRVDWLDVGLRVGGFDGGTGPRRVFTTAVEESLSGLSASLLLGVSSRLLSW